MEGYFAKNITRFLVVFLHGQDSRLFLPLKLLKVVLLCVVVAHRKLRHITLLQYAAENLNYGIEVCW